MITGSRFARDAVFNQVVETFEYKIKEAGIMLHVYELPSCSGDEAQIGKVFSNLIDNALKYLDTQHKGVIRISGTRHLVYCVVDDEIELSRLLNINLSREGYSVDSVESGAEAIRLLKKKSYDLVICDLGVNCIL